MYNSRDFIIETIQSVLAQTYELWEMIIIDDCSTDNSVEIVESYSKNDSRIKLICMEKNQGSAFSRNKGIKEAKGRYIAFLDSDDLWVSSKLKDQLKFMRRMNSVLSFSSYRKIDVHGNVIGKVLINKNDLVYGDLLKTNHIGCLTAMIDVERLGGKMYVPLMLTRNDYAFWLSILKREFLQMA